MKKSILIGLGTLLAVTLGIGVLYAQTSSPEMMDQGRSSGFGQGYGPQGGQYSPYGGARQQDGWNGGPDIRDRGRSTGPDIMNRFLDMFSGMMGRNRDMRSDMMGSGGRGMGSGGQGTGSGGWGMSSGGWGMGSGCR